jgi:hypothetical protein
MNFREALRFTATLLLVGIGVGLLASMFWGPALISWWWTPPGNAGSLTAVCGDQVRDAATALVKMQLTTGAALGALTAALGHFIAWKRRKNADAPPNPAPPSPAPPRT